MESVDLFMGNKIYSKYSMKQNSLWYSMPSIATATFDTYELLALMCLYHIIYMMFFYGGFCHRVNECKVFIYLSFIDCPVIMNVSFSYGIQLSYSSTQNITVLRFADKWYSGWDTHYHNCWFTRFLCHQPISRCIFIQKTALIFEYPIFIKGYDY